MSARTRRGFVHFAVSTVLVSALPFVLFQVRVGMAQSEALGARFDRAIDVQFGSIDQRLRRLEDTHPEAMAADLRANTEAIKTQQTLLWGVLGAVLINLVTQSSPLFTRRRKQGDES